MSIWQVFVKSHDGKSISVTFSRPNDEIAVTELKKEIEKKIGIPPDEQRLIQGGKQLDDKKLLSDYPGLRERCTIFLVLRLPGGAKKPFDVATERQLPRHLPRSDSNCFICLEPPALLMPCKPVKHSVCSTCLANFAWAEASNSGANKSSIKCPLCGSEWGLDVIEEYGQATSKEIELLSECLSMNLIRGDPNIINCPGCTSYCERQDKTKPRVHCRICEKNGRKNPDFCWICLQPWTSSSMTKCNNPECNTTILEQIENAPMIKVVGVSCPSIRLCPNCGTAIEHNTGCKQMICKSCKKDFCFICLRMKMDGSWQCGSYNTQCKPAPKQLTIPQLKCP